MQIIPASLIRQLRDHYPDLSQSGRHIADYLKANPGRAVFLNAAELAQVAGVSPASVVRFARALGYRGYPELQKAIQAELSQQLGEEPDVSTPTDAQPHSWARAMRADQRNLELTVQELDVDAATLASQWLGDARTIYLAGYRSTGSLVRMTHSFLKMVRPAVQVIAVSAEEYCEDLTGADERDVLLCFSFPRYFRLTQDIAAFAKQQQVRCIGITDSPRAPLADVVDITLTCYVTTESFANSFVAPLSLVNALVAAAVQNSKDANVRRLTDIESGWRQQRIFHT